jgi:RimJ/RimL family protein N-acetyltransferase
LLGRIVPDRGCEWLRHFVANDSFHYTPLNKVLGATAMSKPPYSFSSERLEMRTFRTTDAEAVYSYASDPDVTKLMDWPIHSDLSMSAEFISATKAEWDRNAQYTWAITLKDSQILIGAVSCGANAHRVSLGYVLSKNAIWKTMHQQKYLRSAGFIKKEFYAAGQYEQI